MDTPLYKDVLKQINQTQSPPSGGSHQRLFGVWHMLFIAYIYIHVMNSTFNPVDMVPPAFASFLMVINETLPQII